LGAEVCGPKERVVLVFARKLAQCGYCGGIRGEIRQSEVWQACLAQFGKDGVDQRFPVCGGTHKIAIVSGRSSEPVHLPTIGFSCESGDHFQVVSFVGEKQPRAGRTAIRACNRGCPLIRVEDFGRGHAFHQCIPLISQGGIVGNRPMDFYAQEDLVGSAGMAGKQFR